MHNVNLNFDKYTGYSILAHLLLFLISIIGLPKIIDFEDQQQIITFELLPASSINNVKNQQQKKKGRSEEKAKKIKQTKQNSQPPKQNSQPTKPNSKSTSKSVKDTKASANLAKKVPIKQTNVEKKIISKSSSNTPAKVASQKKLPAPPSKTEDPMESLLKNLEEASIGDTKKSPFRSTKIDDLDDKKFSSSDIYHAESPLSITEMMIIKQQIERNWRQPASAVDIEDIKIRIALKLDNDANVVEAEILEIACPVDKNTCKLVAESAIRAIKQANPLENLQAERYDIWKEFELIFSPGLISK